MIRQRLLIVAAAVLSIYAACLMVTRLGRSDAHLRLRPLEDRYRLYEYTQRSEIRLIAQGETRTREIQCALEFRGRKAEGMSAYQSRMSMQLARLIVDGTPVRDMLPRLLLTEPMDFRGRMLVEGRADLFPLEFLHAPEFFPILSGGVSKQGSAWEDQFRIVLPASQEQMIVAVRTVFDGSTFTDNERLTRLRFRGRGEALYSTGEAGGSEQALLVIEGWALWNAEVGAPHSMEHEIELRIHDFDVVREQSAAAARDPDIGLKTARRTKSALKLESKTIPRDRTPLPTATPVEAREGDAL